jgi:hypothetical protein
VGPRLRTSQQAAEHRAAQKIRDTNRRAKVLELVGDGDLRCRCCKSEKKPVVDHIHGGLVRRTGAGHNIEAPILNGSAPASDFQILCARCNMSKGDGIYCKLDHNAEHTS